MPRALAIDVGGTKLAAAVVELPGPGAEPLLTHRRTAPTPAPEGGPAVLSAVTELALAEHTNEDKAEATLDEVLAS